jgi:hypothetical protein
MATEDRSSERAAGMRNGKGNSRIAVITAAEARDGRAGANRTAADAGQCRGACDGKGRVAGIQSRRCIKLTVSLVLTLAACAMVPKESAPKRKILLFFIPLILPLRHTPEIDTEWSRCSVIVYTIGLNSVGHYRPRWPPAKTHRAAISGLQPGCAGRERGTTVEIQAGLSGRPTGGLRGDHPNYFASDVDKIL